MSIAASIITLGGIGALGAVMLGGMARRFRVDEDPRIAHVEALLPGANCGACGYKGCHDFAVHCVALGNLDGFHCPGAGAEGIQRIAVYLGCNTDIASSQKVAVLKCAGTPQTKTPLGAQYTGPQSCAIKAMTAGDYMCQASCLGCGDCVEACRFDAISIDPVSGLPVVDAEKCTGCGMCAATCPKRIIEIRDAGRPGRRVWVACSNCLKGAQARKQCTVACIGCGLCVKACPFEAISVTDNLAHIDPEKCRACGKCVDVCPNHAIHKTF